MEDPIRLLRDNPAESRFEAVLVHGEMAVKPYRLRGDTIALQHTVVPPSHAGIGIARRLNAFARVEAERRGLTVVPKCPYIED